MTDEKGRLTAHQLPRLTVANASSNAICVSCLSQLALIVQVFFGRLGDAFTQLLAARALCRGPLQLITRKKRQDPQMRFADW